MQDDHYDFNYQQSRLVSPSRKLYPGDVFMVECEYDTTDRRKITYVSWDLIQSQGCFIRG